MSATIHTLPERIFRPDMAATLRIIDTTGDSLGQLFELAQMALRGVEAIKTRGEYSDKVGQGIANGLAIACFALALAIGVRRVDIESVIPWEGDAP